MKPMIRRRLVGCFPAFVALTLWSSCDGAELEAAAELGIGQTNNFARTSSRPLHATIASLGLDLTASEDSARAKGDLVANVAYTDYRGVNFDSQLLGSINGNLTLAVAPETLSWRVDETYGQVRREMFSAPSPLNTESINYSSTGPDLLLRLGGAGRLLLSGRYSRVDYEKSAFDSDRWLGGVSIGRSIRAGSELLLNFQSEETKFAEGSAAADYVTKRSYLSLTRQGARTSTSLFVGYNQIDRAGRITSSPLLRIDLNRKVGQMMTFTITAGREMADVPGALRLDAGAAVARGNYETMAEVSDPFNRSYGSVGVAALGRRTQLAFDVMLSQDKYIVSTQLDHRRSTTQFSASRSITAGLKFGTALSLSRDNFLHTPGDSSEIHGALDLTWRASRLLSFAISGERFRRSSDGEADANESRAWLRVRYGSEAAGVR